jgi:hypothetical protein
MSYQTMTSVADAIRVLPVPYPPVRLITHYKATTLNQQGRIVDITPRSATVQATQRLTFHIMSGTVHLRTEAFPGAISANIHPVDYTDGTFSLSNLSYGDWRDRKTERVQPKCPMYIDIKFHRKIYRACVEDICDEGMGILVNKDLEPDSRLRPGAKLLLEFRLAPGHILFNLIGIVVYRMNVGQQLIKFGLQLRPDAIQKKSLRAYVMHRHDEILRELEQEHFQMCERFRIEYQYF